MQSKTTAGAKQQNSKESGGDDWQEVRRKKNNTNRTVQNELRVIRGGNKTMDSLRAAPKKIYLHISRLCPETKAEDVQRYLNQLCQGVMVEKLNSRHPDEYSSFKLTALCEHAAVLKNPDTWPSGTNIKRFFLARK